MDNKRQASSGGRPAKQMKLDAHFFKKLPTSETSANTASVCVEPSVTSITSSILIPFYETSSTLLSSLTEVSPSSETLLVMEFIPVDDTASTLNPGVQNSEADTMQPSISTTLINDPSQPRKAFPLRFYGTKGRKFSAAYFDEFPWIHWVEEKAAVICYICANVHNLGGPMFCKRGEKPFAGEGYNGWKDQRLAYASHEKSASHAECVLKWK